MDDLSLRLFGSELRTKLLLYLALLQESYAQELANLARVSRVTAYHALGRLEREGYISSVTSGQERWVRLNPRNPVSEPLRMLLMRMAEGRPEVLETVSNLRRRPRRRGKEVDRPL